MRTAETIYWELIRSVRSLAPHVGISLAALATAAIGVSGLTLLTLFTPESTLATGAIATAPSAFHLSLTENRATFAFLIVLLWALALCLVLAPACVAGSFIRDRLSHRVERQLGDAPSSLALAWAKLIGGIAPVILALLVTLPLLSLPALYGSLSALSIGPSFAVLLSVVLLAAAVSLIWSALASTETVAVFGAYVCIVIVLLGPLAAYAGAALTQHSQLGLIAAAFDPLTTLVAIHPGLTFGATRMLPLSWPAIPASLSLRLPGLAVLIPLWLVNTVFNVAFSLVLIWITSVVIEPFHAIKMRLSRHKVGIVR